MSDQLPEVDVNEVDGDEEIEVGHPQYANDPDNGPGVDSHQDDLSASEAKPSVQPQYEDVQEVIDGTENRPVDR